MGGRALGDGGRESDIVAMLEWFMEGKTAAATWAADIDIERCKRYYSV